MEKAYERLIRYAKVHTTSDEESGTHPSFKGEADLANMLCEELKDIKLENYEHQGKISMPVTE